MLASQMKVGAAPGTHFNGTTTQIRGTNQTTTIHDEYEKNYQDTKQSGMEFDITSRFSREWFDHVDSSGTINRKTQYADIALSDDFLNEYYSQVLC